jgi:hypothetical protein
MGTKYNGLIVFLLLSIFVPFLHAKYRARNRVSLLNSLAQSLVFVSLAVLVFSPWMIRNYLWTQNPFYPLYDHWFNVQTDISPSGGILAYRSLIYHEQWWEIALIPARIFFQGQDNNPQYFDGKLNPLLLFLPLFAFLRLKNETQPIIRERMILLGFAVLYFVFVFFTSNMRVRYVLPMIPPLVLLSVIGLRNLLSLFAGLVSDWKRRTLWMGTVCTVSIFLLMNVQYVITQFEYIRPFSYLDGSVDRDEFISKHRPEYTVIQYINENLPSNALVLFLFMGKRGYYCERDYVLDMKRDRSTIQETAEKAGKAEDILRRFLDLRITHIVMDQRLFVQWVQSSFSPNARLLMQQFMNKYLDLLYTRNGYSLYVFKQEPLE